MGESAYFRKAKRWDAVARWVITGGGIAIIASVIAILVMIARVALPLFFPAHAEMLTQQSLPGQLDPAEVRGLGVDEYNRVGFVIDRGGEVTFTDLATGEVRERVQIEAPGGSGAEIVDADYKNEYEFTLMWSDGSASLDRVEFKVVYDEAGNRSMTHWVERLYEVASAAGAPKAERALIRQGDGGRTAVLIYGDGRIEIRKEIETTNFLGETSLEEERFELSSPVAISAVEVDNAGEKLYLGSPDGQLLRWDISAAESVRLLDEVQAFEDRRAITALGLLFGDISLAVGDEQGGLSTWFPVSEERLSHRRILRRIHELKGHAGAVERIRASLRDKSLLSLSADGRLHMDHMTSERHLMSFGGEAPILQFALNGRGNGLLAMTEDGVLRLWDVQNPHPEISWSTLFGKVWYENYPEPDYVWQSSAATDDFEPKLSLVPLIFGTFKGTLYAMIFALPIAVLGALYMSQFMRPTMRKIIKPMVEIMAAIPSVVIGFLAALWLAPRIEYSVPSVFLWVAFMPLLVVVSLLLWQRFERYPLMRRWGHGTEFVLMIPIVILGTWAIIAVAPWVEVNVFGGSFPQWLYDTIDHRYDQRNCIIIAFALGFTVIPIIFTIADDALSNIPGSLTAASLALGASRWQTAWRVVLPSASPGIFAATMIGFGRAVGETMIVLMATGNTPILDWSIFNGMRTLSANIAVEIPEAPVDGTLYRVLYLTAVLLFCLTFIINTVAELVRQRLRKKYGQLV